MNSKQSNASTIPEYTVEYWYRLACTNCGWKHIWLNRSTFLELKDRCRDDGNWPECCENPVFTTEKTEDPDH